MHESQSRFFENYIGRSEAFCGVLLPKLQEIFPDHFADVTAHELFLAVNKAEPSLIRIQADELTYSMHIVIRYEIEKMLFDGAIAVAQIPETWRHLYKEYLGVDVPDDEHGALQDVHWSGGMFGQFPAYSLGSAYACCDEEGF
jgi:Zn-dependent carboxypeptidase